MGRYLMSLQIDLIVEDYETIFQALRIQAQIMRCLKMRFQMWVVDIVLISSGTVLYAEEALLVPIAAMREELVVVIEGDATELAGWMPCEACPFFVFHSTTRLWITFLDVLFQLVRCI